MERITIMWIYIEHLIIVNNFKAYCVEITTLKWLLTLLQIKNIIQRKLELRIIMRKYLEHFIKLLIVIKQIPEQVSVKTINKRQ